jgi:hypothetical protein
MAGPIRIAILANATQAAREMGTVETRGQKMQRALGAATKVAAAGFAAAGVGAYKAAQAAAADEAAQSKLAQTLKTAAGASKGQIASTEGWIAAQGKATGITDDELRPALGKLATATGSVAKAQKLAALAMDISAGSGKSLDGVAQALAKAQATGSVTALSKYGVATKNAAGETRSLAAITRDLGGKYQGAAAKAAETTAGKQKILTTQLGELQEKIGAGLLPVMGKMVSIGLRAVEWLTRNTGAAKIVAGVLVGLGVTVLATSAAFKVYTATTRIVTAVTKAWAIAQRIVNGVMKANPIMLAVTAIMALVGAFVYAYRKSETFRRIVDKSWGAIKTATGAVWGFLKRITVATWNAIKTAVTAPARAIGAAVRGAWNALRSATRTAWNAIKSAISGVWNNIKSNVKSATGSVKNAIGDAWAWVKGKTSDLWGAFVGIIRDKISDAVAKVREIKGKVTGAFSGASDWLVNIGQNILNGLVRGLETARQWVIDKIRQVTDSIPDWVKRRLGISSPSKVFDAIGRNVGLGLARGIARSRKEVKGAAGRMARDVEAGFRAPRLTLATNGTPYVAPAVAGGVPVHVTVNVPPTADKAAIGREISAALDAYFRQGGRRRA